MQTQPPDASQLALQLVWLMVLALPIASVAWTVTHEEVFRELRERCEAASRASRTLVVRKFFYLFTCEYCFSHYVAIFFIALVPWSLWWLQRHERGPLEALWAQATYGRSHVIEPRTATG